MFNFLVPLAGAAISTIGNLFGASKSSEATKEANAAALADKERDRELQREFAQSGIQWRVQDAIKAGIHPLAALGGSGATYSPSAISISPDTSMGSALAASGQDISRAINATRSQGERDRAFSKSIQDLQLTKMGLENELLASQIAKLRSNTNPPMPDNVGGGAIAVPGPGKAGLKMGGVVVGADPKTSDAQDWTNRYGETIGDWVAPIGIVYNDLKHNYGKIIPEEPGYMSWLDRVVPKDFYSRYSKAIRGAGWYR